MSRKPIPLKTKNPSGGLQKFAEFIRRAPGAALKAPRLGKRLSPAAFALAAAMAMSGCAGFWQALGEGDSTEHVYCEKRRVGYAVTDGKRTEVYRQTCPQWVDTARETRERAAENERRQRLGELYSAWLCREYGEECGE